MNHVTSAKTIGLVGCGRQKRSQPTLARDIYTSPFFRFKRRYAEEFADSWFIISAKYHLLAPEQIIEPYDETLKKTRVKTQKDWATIIAEQLRKVAAPKDTIIILAGKDYFKQLLPLIQEFIVELPLAGKRQGEQIRWLKEQLEKARDHDDK